MSDDELITTEEIAMLLKLSPSTIKAWRVKKMGPAYIRITGRTCRYRMKDITEWLQKKALKPKLID